MIALNPSFLENTTSNNGLDKNKSLNTLFVTQITTALALIVSLAWNDAVKQSEQILFKRYPRLKLLGPWMYAIFITFFVFGILYLLHIFDYDVIKIADKHKIKKSI